MSVLLLGACALLSSSGAVPQPEKKPFSHFEHVPPAWYERSGGRFANTEVARDCRGCHDYRTPGRDPHLTCRECHVGPTFRPNAKPGFEAGFRREPDRSFEHGDHLGLSCRQCHAPEGAEPTDPMPIVRGAGTCASCHAPAGTATPLDRPEGTQPDEKSRLGGFLASLDASPRMRPDALRLPFEHRNHLRDSARPSPGECRTCHADVAKLETPAGQVSSERCGTCHLSSSGPLAFAIEGGSRASRCGGTFSHADHVRTARATPLEEIAPEEVAGRVAEQGCLACHRAEGPRPDFAVREDVQGYSGCVSCHALPAWKTKNHGSWGGTGGANACVSCHTFGTRDMKQDRPHSTVARAPAGSLVFAMPAQAHPGIAGGAQKECAGCHRAPVGELPSRIVRARFEHASHLPPEPKEEHCARCHAKTVDPTRRSAELGSTFAGVAIDPAAQPAQYGRSYDASACADCHSGLVAEVLPEVAPQESTAVEFSHAAHLGKTTRALQEPITCTTCHAAGAVKTGGLVGTKERARSCVECHRHETAGEDELFRRTGDIARDEVQSCARCHGQGVPAVGATSAGATSRVAAAAGGDQLHPPGRDCAECHLVLEDEAVALGDTLDPESGRDLLGGRASDAHTLVDQRMSNCYGCHWKPNRQVVAVGDPASVRASVGASLDRYPGEASARPAVR